MTMLFVREMVLPAAVHHRRVAEVSLVDGVAVHSKTASVVPMVHTAVRLDLSAASKPRPVVH